MKADKQSRLTPKLRFPEFKDAGEWEERQLRNVCERIMDGTHFSPKSKDGPRPYLTSKNIRNGWLDLSTISGISEKEHREIFTRCPVQQYDVLLTKDGANTGTCAINPLDYEFSLLSSVAVLRGNASLVTQQFLFQSVISDRMQSTIRNSMSGQAITRITLEKLGGYAIALPKIAEQQKIADCLGSLDDLIAAEGEKLEALRRHKQGLMQQLFPQPGETVPRLRFPEFVDKEEWEDYSLGEVCEMKAGDFVNASEIFEVQKDGFFPCYGGNGLRGFVKSYTHNGLYVLVGRQGALCGNVKLFEGCFHATEHALVATPFSGINTHWLYYALDILKLNRFATGQAQPGLSVTILNAIPITVPADRKEQQRIASCLGSLDDRIAAQARRIEALKTHKQGLLQQLFPSPEGNE